MPIIGVITRTSISKEGNKTNIIYSDIVSALINNGGNPIGIIPNKNIYNLINLCDGIIFQGGDEFEFYDKDILSYCYEIDKPVLGICLGMQLMGVLFNGTMIDISNHKKKLHYAHSIKIRNNSKLYNIFKSNIIKVNSRHNSVIKNTDLFISAISNDGYIEAIEAINKTFFIGVQWHPESMIDYDKRQNNLFKYFIKCCSKKL